MFEQETKRRLAGWESEEQVEQAGVRISHQTVVIGRALAAAQLLQPSLLGPVTGVVREGSQQRLFRNCSYFKAPGQNELERTSLRYMLG